MERINVLYKVLMGGHVNKCSDHRRSHLHSSVSRGDNAPSLLSNREGQLCSLVTISCPSIVILAICMTLHLTDGEKISPLLEKSARSQSPPVLCREKSRKSCDFNQTMAFLHQSFPSWAFPLQSLFYAPSVERLHFTHKIFFFLSLSRNPPRKVASANALFWDQRPPWNFPPLIHVSKRPITPAGDALVN